MPSIEQSILFAKELSSLDGFAVKNPVRQWFPGAREAIQGGGLPNKVRKRIQCMQKGMVLYTYPPLLSMFRPF